MSENDFSYLKSARVLVAGAGGFIGGHLVQRLVDHGVDVRCVDVRPVDQWYQLQEEADNWSADVSVFEEARRAVRGCSIIFNLAADMGGMGFIENNKALCMLSVLINTHMLMAAREFDVQRYFFASSACVYAADKQRDPDVIALREVDAYPAEPEDGYGWEKLFSERMCRHFTEDFGVSTYVARYHNVYGPKGTWTGGREKAPAALCRKVAEARLSGAPAIEIWGDGKQTRSFMYVDDCVDGTLKLTGSDFHAPLNIGSSELVSVDGLVSIIEDIAGYSVERTYNLDAPKGVAGRNSDNTLVRQVLGWEPSITLRDGLASTFEWVSAQVEAESALAESD